MNSECGTRNAEGQETGSAELGTRNAEGKKLKCIQNQKVPMI